MFNKVLTTAVAAGTFALMATSANATVTYYSTVSSFVSAASGGGAPANQVADNINWGVFADSLSTSRDNGTISTPSSMTTVAGETVTAKSGDGNAFTTYTQGAGTWNGDFSTGTTVLYTSATVATQPITLAFASAVSGLGVHLQTYDPGSYNFTLTAYSNVGVGCSATNVTACTQLGSVTSSSGNSTGTSTSNPNTAVFEGILTGAYNISYVTIGNNNGGDGFAIDTSLIYHTNINGKSNPDPQQGGAVPEPGTLALMGTSLAGLGWFRRRRKMI